MNRLGDLDRVLSDWLQEGAYDAPVGPVEAAIEHARRSPRHVDIFAFLREDAMRTTQSIFGFRPAPILALLALAIAVVALVIGGGLLNHTPPPIPTASPGPSALGSVAPTEGATSNPSTAPSLPPITLANRVDIDAAAIGLNIPNPQPAAGTYTGGVDIGPDGNLYVVSDATSEIVVMTPDGALVRRWGHAGTGAGAFRPGWALDVAVAPDGTVYVSEGSHFDQTASVPPRIQAFTPEGSFKHGWGAYGTAAGQFWNVLAIDIGPDGDVYAVDDQRDVIDRFRPDGTFVAMIGGHGKAPGQLYNTGVIRVGPDGTVYNADWEIARIQAWSADGAFLWTFGTFGFGPGQLNRPADLAVAPDGRIFVIDLQRLQLFSASHEPVAAIILPARTLDRIVSEDAHL